MADGSECGAVALLVLCGLPGAGKTTLCCKLREYLCRKKQTVFHVLHICYDELIPSDIQGEVSVKSSSEHSTSTSDISEGISDNYCSWKSYRRLIIDSVEKLASFNKCNVEKEQPLDKEIFHHKLLQEFWPKFLQSISGTEKNCGCISRNATRWDTAYHVIVIDDNMFYRSMRYEYFQLARKHGLGFAEIFLECSTNFALTRNAQRSVQVSGNTITTMVTKIETPEPDKFPWEHNSLKLDAGSSLSTESLELIEKLVIHAIQNPVPPLAEEGNLEEKEASRAVCLESILHQSDQTLRKHIGKIMASAKASGKTKPELSSLGNQLNTKRKMLLEEIRNIKLGTRQANSKESHSQEKRDEGVVNELDDGFDDLISDSTTRKTILKMLSDSLDNQQIELIIKDIFDNYNTPLSVK